MLGKLKWWKLFLCYSKREDYGEGSATLKVGLKEAHWGSKKIKTAN